MNALICDRCGALFEKQELPAVSLKLGTAKVLKSVLPQKWGSIPKDERDFYCFSHHLDIDLCPACQESVCFWLRIGRAGGEQ